MISIFVTINIKDGFRDQFVEAVLDDARGSVRDEAGCYRFDVLQDSENPNRIHLYEVYADSAALDAHRNAPHYTKWRSTVEPWFDGEIHRVSTSTVFPSDEGWKTQKPGLLNW
ncbi:antibiotic biosynthesis monooxygenase [SAR202 cluster bacterium AD-804-J14_MRT_500m]|nr:antibiotic biosynthesis monooxygenase [SAR202 cluster bacterium AD-804-J14_MRT_500m]